MSDLPDHLSLTSLCEQAKSPHSCFRNDDADALALVCENHPKPDRFSSLGDAQRLVASQYGYRGWSELFEAVETALDEASLLEQRADLFADMPGLLVNKIFVDLAAADVAALKTAIEVNPDCVNETGGSRNWPPLMYLAYSRVVSCERSFKGHTPALDVA